MILIIGGAGYIGSHVNKLLNQKGYQTVVFDSLVTGHKEFVKWGELFVGDLKNISNIQDCFKKYSIDAVLHFGAFIEVGESVSNPHKYYTNNVVNTLNLLAVMRDFGVKRIVFSSTCAVYGYPQELPLKESHPFDPINPYGKTKMMVEQILRDFDVAYEIKSVCLRYFNASGADAEADIGEWHEPESHLIPLGIFAAQGKRESMSIFGDDYPTKDGTCVRDYIHVTDLAQAHLLALKYLEKNQKSEAFNLGNGEGYTVKEVLESIQKITQKKFKIQVAPRRPGDPPVLVGSSQKAKTILGWQPQHEQLDEIVASAWKWHQKF